MIRILLAEDHHVVRTAVASFLKQEADMDVVGEASDADELLQLLATKRADVLLLDARMPGSRVTNLVGTIHRLYPTLAILILSAYQRREYVLGALKRGAMGYVLKDDAPDMLVEAIRQVVLDGRPYVSPRVAGVLTHALQEDTADPIDQLSPREYDVLLLMPYGLSNEQIAAKLNLEKQTVKNYTRSMFRKLGVTSRLEAAIYAYRHGLADPDATAPLVGGDE